MNIKLTNGKKIIVRSKIQYEANVKHFEMRGFYPVDSEKKVASSKPKKKELE